MLVIGKADVPWNALAQIQGEHNQRIVEALLLEDLQLSGPNVFVLPNLPNALAVCPRVEVGVWLIYPD